MITIEKILRLINFIPPETKIVKYIGEDEDGKEHFTQVHVVRYNPEKKQLEIK
ncbi:MAG: hypothetical protein HUJ68_02720 [Clostridia bacterium]|nr:hypothetical protein [Clostridia bacterium]